MGFLEKWGSIILIGICLFGLGFAKGCAYQAKEHDLYVAKMEVDSAKLLSGVLQRNAAKLAKYEADAKQKDSDYAKKIAIYRGAVKSGSVFNPGGQGCGSPAAARANGAGSAETAASGERVVPTPRSVAIGEPEVATVLGWYAYAETCWQWIHFK